MKKVKHGLVWSGSIWLNELLGDKFASAPVCLLLASCATNWNVFYIHVGQDDGQKKVIDINSARAYLRLSLC